MLAEYFSKCGELALDRISFYCARTYLKHLIHTVRMRGTEDPQSVTLWLDKAEACLTDFRADLFQKFKESSKVRSLLSQLAELGSTPLQLFRFRGQLNKGN